MTLLRKTLGKINWVAVLTRPEISYHIAKISVRAKNATAPDVHTINKVIKYMENTPSNITVTVFA